MAIKTALELVEACKNLEKNYKTLYVMGCFGAPMTAANKKRYTSNHSYNRNATRTQMINAASADTFGFDCVCMIKGLLWGWSGKKNTSYGGASYAVNGVPDIGADAMIEKCKDVSTDFSNIQVGEAVWLSGHIGLYIGDGLVIECSPKWDNGVQTTALLNIGKKSGYHGRTWTKHGKLPYVTYPSIESKPATKPASTTSVSNNASMPVLKKGDKGATVKATQILLIGYGYSCGSYGADGDFGTATYNAVVKYQKAMKLDADGVVGSKTWNKLLGL